jgi:hypothetical protein
MQVLFVHGMGRSPISGWPVLRRLKSAGFAPATFGYIVSVEDFPTIRTRLAARLCELSAAGDYLLIGHSLGGVLLRSALSALPPGVRQPRHLFLLGSPQQPVTLARRLGKHWLFRLLAGDCGQLLGSAERMNAVGAVTVPVTSIVGTRGLPLGYGPFNGEANDGVISVSEASAAWIDDQVLLPVMHTLLPSSGQTARVILDRLGR